MNLNQVFHTSELSEVEQDIVRTAFSDHVVKKYLRIMAQNDITELATLSISNLSDSEVSKKHSLVQGKLSTLVTLLSIKKEGASS